MTWRALSIGTGHVIKRILNTGFLNQTAFYDVAITIHQCSPRHQTHFKHSFPELNGIL